VRAGIGYVDTTQAFVDETRKTGTWLHFPDDAHPTVAGHRLIADEVARYLRETDDPSTATLEPST
jgi:lysophospholipase L1-like esterase